MSIKLDRNKFPKAFLRFPSVLLKGLICPSILVASLFTVCLTLNPNESNAFLMAVDGPSSIKVEERVGGFLDWDVAGVDVMNGEKFWYRVGDTGGERPVTAFDSQGSPSLTLNNAIANGNQITLDYGLRDVDSIGVNINYTLEASEQNPLARVIETVQVRNLANTIIDVAFFLESSYFTLGPDGFAEFFSGPTPNIFQQGLAGPALTPPVSATALTISWTPIAAWEIANSGDLLARLSDNQPTALDNSIAQELGPGLISHAFEYQFSLAPDEHFTIEVEKRVRVAIIPEPGTLFLLLLGLAGIGFARLRSKTA